MSAAPSPGFQGMPELPLPSTGKLWSAGDNKFSTHLGRRVTGQCELQCISLVQTFCLCSPNEEFMRGVQRAAEPTGSPVNSEDLKKSRVCIPMDTWMRATGFSERAIQMGLAHAAERKFLGMEPDKNGRPFYWAQPEYYATGELRKCRRVNREKKFHGAASVNARETLAAFEMQSSAGGQPSAFIRDVGVTGENTHAQPSAGVQSSAGYQNVTAPPVTRINGEDIPQPSAGVQPSTEIRRQPIAENAQPGSDIHAAECTGDPSCPLLLRVETGERENLARNAHSAAGSGSEATQLTEALPELVAKLGLVNRQTAVNLIAAARLATVLLVVGFLRKKARESREHAEWKTWGAPVAAVRNELHLEVARIFPSDGLSALYTGPPVEDDFVPFLEGCANCGLSCSGADIEAARQLWQTLTTEDRMAAAQGLYARKQSGEWDDPTFRPLPDNYIRKRIWLRELRPRAGPGTTETKANREFRERAERALRWADEKDRERDG